MPPASYSVYVSLNSLDGHEENETLVMPMVIKGINTYEVTLPFRKLWNYTLTSLWLLVRNILFGWYARNIIIILFLSSVVSVSGCSSHTHDAQNISVTTTASPGQLRMTADLIFGSTAIGLLVIVYSLTTQTYITILSTPS